METNYEDLLSRNNFDNIIKISNVPPYVSNDFLFDIYSNVTSSLIKIFESQNVNPIGRIQPFAVVNYLISEHIYSTLGMSNEDIKKVEENEIYGQRIAGIVIDKYFTIDHFEYNEGSLGNYYYPPLTSMKLYINYILHSLKKFKQKDPEQTLLVDVIHKGLRMCQCICNLLSSGFETEAFSTWRTLHETECNAIVLFKYGKPVIDAYLRHIKYGLAFRNALGSVEETDQTFVEIKSIMKEHGLKSKDMKRFIECGWLYAVPNINENEEFRINFRNGVEMIAGLSNMNSRYEMSSEIAHSSPLLIYSNRNFFFYMSIVCMYESFLRIEKIFNLIYSQTMQGDDLKSYQVVRQTYLPQLEIILQIEQKHLQKNEKA